MSSWEETEGAGPSRPTVAVWGVWGEKRGDSERREEKRERERKECEGLEESPRGGEDLCKHEINLMAAAEDAKWDFFGVVSIQ